MENRTCDVTWQMRIVFVTLQFLLIELFTGSLRDLGSIR